MGYPSDLKNAALQGSIGNAYGATTGGYVNFQRQDGPGTTVSISHQLSGAGAARLDKALREIIADDGPILQAEQQGAFERQRAAMQMQHGGQGVAGDARGINQ